MTRQARPPADVVLLRRRWAGRPATGVPAMAGQASLRRKVLTEAYRLSEGDTDRPIGLAELAEALHWPVKELAVIAGQLAEQKLIRYVQRTLDPTFQAWTVAITMRGIEESERAARPAFARWRDEHPGLYAISLSVSGAIVSGIILKLLGVLLGW